MIDLIREEKTSHLKGHGDIYEVLFVKKLQMITYTNYIAFIYNTEI